ncbi:MAG: hypothetical protein K6F70_03840 [Eggerthellaceae bacterium]|nr:hypothetical protein [Eggerthellaceae bacterium]
MQCPRCGARNSKQAERCHACGMPLVQTGGRVVPVQVHHNRSRLADRQMRPQGGAYSAVPLYERRQPWYQKALIFIVAVAVIVGVIFGVYSAFQAFQNDKVSQAAYDAEHVKQTVKVTFDVPEYKAGSSSVIPIRVQGTDIDGNAVDDLHLMTLADNTVELMPGTYSFVPAGSPVTAAGITYAVPAAVNVSATSSGVTVGSTEGATVSLSYSAIQPIDATDDQIAAIKQWMTEASLEDATIQKYVDAITNARTAAQEEEAEASGSIVETDYFTFTIPSLWRDEVSTKTTKSNGLPTVTVYLDGYSSLELMTVTCVKDGGESDEEDNVDHIAGTVQGTGYRVEIWTTNWAYYASLMAQGSVDPIVSTSVLEDLVRLSSGGSLTYDDVSEMSKSAIGTPDIEFVSDNVLPTLKATGSVDSSSSGSSDDEDYVTTTTTTTTTTKRSN